LWQKNLSEMKAQLAEIYIISDTMLILTAAKTMALLSGFKIKPVRSFAEIPGYAS
jgi:hypothetical protein